MRNLIVLTVSVMLFLSCGICKKYFDDKPTKKSESLEEKKETEINHLNNDNEDEISRNNKI